MRIEKGTARTVFIFPSLNIALKIAMFNLSSTKKLLIRIIKSGQIKKRLRDEFFLFTCDSKGTLKKYLLRGITENLNEYIFYVRHRKKLPIQPTYISLFGICNIVKIASPLRLSDEAWRMWWSNIVNIIGCTIIKDPHIFEKSENFSREGDALMFLDYGSKKTQAILRTHGKKFFNFYKNTGA